MLGLSFPLLIGMLLIAEGMGQKVPKGYMYAAIASSVLVEALNSSNSIDRPDIRSARPRSR